MKGETGKTRKTVWLKVNGKANTLRGHFKANGYRPGYPSTVSKQQDMKQSEIPIEVWREYFGEDCHFCEMPGNWKTIIYGSEKGAQTNRELGKPISYPVGRAPKRSKVIDAQLGFLTRHLTQNPANRTHYYY